MDPFLFLPLLYLFGMEDATDYVGNIFFLVIGLLVLI
jgi:hypothetical protein